MSPGVVNVCSFRLRHIFFFAPLARIRSSGCSGRAGESWEKPTFLSTSTISKTPGTFTRSARGIHFTQSVRPQQARQCPGVAHLHRTFHFTTTACIAGLIL